jgi:hypothetical protein
MYTLAKRGSVARVCKMAFCTLWRLHVFGLFFVQHAQLHHARLYILLNYILNIIHFEKTLRKHELHFL